MTKVIMHRAGEHLETRVGGGDLNPDLADDVVFINLTPLDESLGEGFHMGHDP